MGKSDTHQGRTLGDCTLKGGIVGKVFRPEARTGYDAYYVLGSIKPGMMIVDAHYPGESYFEESLVWDLKNHWADIEMKGREGERIKRRAVRERNQSITFIVG